MRDIKTQALASAFTLAAAIALSLNANPVHAGNTGSNGNPWPGYSHDTLNLHLKQAASGHAAFVLYNATNGEVQATNTFITMTGAA